MTCRELIELLEQSYPPQIAESWDNSGLIAGRWEKEIKRVYIALDATTKAIRAAQDCHADLLLTHHPLLMQPLKKIHTGDFYGRRLWELIQHDICCYAMHTTYDIVKMAKLAGEMLGLLDMEILEETCILADGTPAGFGTIGRLPEAMTLAACASHVKKVFAIPNVKVFGAPDDIVYRAAVLPGSGKSMVKSALAKKADVYISGDFGHHDGLDAADQGLNVIDAGHYGIEHIFIAQMKAELNSRFPELEIVTEDIAHPFYVV